MSISTKLFEKRIRRVREAAEDINSAYLLRTRIHRLVLSLEAGLREGEAFSDPETHATVLALTADLRNQTNHMSQRSTCLDEDWEASWQSVDQQLALIESVVKRS